MKIAYLSQKNIWITIASVVVLLILAATILSQAAFKADQTSLAMYLNPPTKTLAVNEQFTSTIKIQPVSSAIITGVQVMLGFDKSVLELSGAVSAEGYQTKKLTNKDGNVFWAMVPDTQMSTVAGQDISLGTMKFTALKASSTQIVFNQSKTIVVTLDAATTPSIYNGLSSTQSSYVTVSGENSNPIDLPLIQPSSTKAISDLVSAQRVKKIEATPIYDSALINVDLLYRGRLRVDFGETEKLGTTLEPTSVTAHHGIKLMGLKSNTRYFYQVTVISPDKTNQIAAAVRSFVTVPALVIGGDVADIKVFAYPAEAKDTTTIYLIPTNKDGQIVSGGKLKLAASQGRATISSIAELNGLYQATISSQMASKQTVQLFASVDSGVSSVTSLTFDPNYNDSSEPVNAADEYLTLNQKIIMLLAALIAGLMILGLFFVKLARLK